MDKKIRAAIIGLGQNTPGKGGAHSIAYLHAWGYAATEGIELVGGCSRSQKNVDDFVVEFPGCAGFVDYNEMLSKLKPELVSVCAYAPDREEMVCASLDNGAKGVLIEKPFALNMAAVERMIAKADKCGARLFVNHQRRYGKPFEALLDASKNIGRLHGVDIVQPFDCILNFGSHLIDAALFVLGPERKVKNIIAAVDYSNASDWQGVKVESHSIASIHFDDGVRLTYEAGKISKTAAPLIRVNGSDGFAELHMEPADGAKNVFRALTVGSGKVVSLDSTEHIHHSEDQALYMKRAVKDIYLALTEGKETRIDAGNAYIGMQIMMGIYKSAETRSMMSLEEVK